MREGNGSQIKMDLPQGVELLALVRKWVADSNDIIEIHSVARNADRDTETEAHYDCVWSYIEGSDGNHTMEIYYDTLTKTFEYYYPGFPDDDYYPDYYEDNGCDVFDTGVGGYCEY